MLTSLKDLDVKGKRVLVRVDFNVPQDKTGKITDDTRIKAALPTIQYLLDQGSTVILMSHLGRPKGKEEKFSLKPCAERLEALIGKKVLFISDCLDEKSVANAPKGSLILLENVRFYPAEEEPEKDPEFAKKLSRLGDCYVNDAFGTAHRAHASTCTIAQYFPNKRAVGFLLDREVKFLKNALDDPKRPFMAIVGGAKVSTKLGVIKALIEKTDSLFIGGAMAFTFFKAQGIAIGKSLFEEKFIEEAKTILTSKKKIYLPIDLVITNSLSEPRIVQIIDVNHGIPDDFQGVDIGPETIDLWKSLFLNAKTLLWNGPVGIFEIPQFSTGTNSIAKALSEMKETITIVGGGDSVAALEQLKLQDKISHVSTGGGASLELIEFGTLPGLEALKSFT